MSRAPTPPFATLPPPMNPHDCPQLRHHCATTPALAHLQERDCATLFQHARAASEAALWNHGFAPDQLPQQQQLYRLWEQWRAAQQQPRHPITLLIPVADRPQQLRNCLASLLELCHCYAYGGEQQGRYPLVEVVLIDDSRDPANRHQHHAIAAQTSAAGVTTHHLDHPQQWAELERLTPRQRAALEPSLQALTPQRMGHKGASTTRNLAYLWLWHHRCDGTPRLFHFLDSDQEFRIRLRSADGEAEPYALNYLHHLDQLFRDHPQLQVLTGKVVGDPPVAPAVMANNLLLDLHALLQQLAASHPEQHCTFHHHPTPGHADYHDHADLFGLPTRPQPQPYLCPLHACHPHSATFTHLAQQLDRFFDGEHPTRSTYYHHQPLAATLQPARTLYTGNYTLRSNALQWYIPLAHLRLRMAGPLLGRILSATASATFCSANLPMLHRRTLSTLGRAEYRHGIQRSAQRTDISEEFARQFLGDLTLFTIEALYQDAPQRAWSAAQIHAQLGRTEADLSERYNAKQQQLQQRLTALRTLFHNPDNWWWNAPQFTSACSAITHFLDNIEQNFAPQAAGYTLINSPHQLAPHKARIAAAIAAYPQQQSNWQQLLDGTLKP